MKILLALIFVVALLAAGSCRGIVDKGVSSQLKESRMSAVLEAAIQDKDNRAATNAVSVVLVDVLERKYRYGYDARRSATAAIRELGLKGMIPLIRRVAAMPEDHGVVPEGEIGRGGAETRGFLDLVAVSDALTTLAILGDPEAVPLNRLQIHSRLARTAALINLRTMGVWEATAEVRQVAEMIMPSPSEIGDLTAALQFLGASPRRSKEDCVLVLRLEGAYRQCSGEGHGEPRGLSGCDGFVLALRQLSAHLACDRP